MEKLKKAILHFKIYITTVHPVQMSSFLDSCITIVIIYKPRKVERKQKGLIDL